MALVRVRGVPLLVATLVAFQLLAPISNVRPRVEAANEATPALPEPEDPIGQQPEQRTSDISIDVDVRDGHLTVRVVDIWGPGKRPLVFRSYTNSSYTADNKACYSILKGLPAYRWFFNHHLDITCDLPTGRQLALEPDGSRSVYVPNPALDRNEDTAFIQVFEKKIGAYSTMEKRYNCTGSSPARTRTAPRPPTAIPFPTPHRPPLPEPPFVWRGPVTLQQAARGAAVPSGCSWDGTHLIKYGKGRVRQFVNWQIDSETDANGNTIKWKYKLLPEGAGRYVDYVEFPNGNPTGPRVTYSYEQDYQVCMDQEQSQTCNNPAWVYRVASVTDPYNRTATYKWPLPDVMKVTNPAQTTTTYKYKAFSYVDTGSSAFVQTTLLIEVTNGRQYTTTVDWGWFKDLNQPVTFCVTKVKAPGDGAITTYVYRSTTELVFCSSGGTATGQNVVTDARGKKTTYFLYTGTDENFKGNIEKVTDHLTNATNYTYDNRHNVKELLDARNVLTKYEYDGRNNVTKIIRDAGTGKLNLTSDYQWDQHDNLKEFINSRRIKACYEYDTKHNLKSIKRDCAGASPSETVYEYWGWGGLKTVTPPLRGTTTYNYDNRRRLTSVVPPVGQPITYGYDNATDDRTSMTNGRGFTWLYAFDRARNLTDEIDPSPLSYKTTYVYDANGNRTKVIEPLQQGTQKATVFTYDPRDRLTKITDARDAATSYEYDLVGNLKKITDGRGKSTSFDFDDLNRLEKVTDPLLQGTEYGYDTVSNRTSMKDRNGTTFTYTYDAVNRLEKVKRGTVDVASFTYDPNGNRLTMDDAPADANAGLTTYAYTNSDQLKTVTYPDQRKVEYTYEPDGNRKTLKNPSGAVTTYSYNTGGWLNQIDEGARQWIARYDEAGNRESLTAPNGTTTSYKYLQNNWLESITHKSPSGTVFQSFTYAYDANGNRRSQTDPTGKTDFEYNWTNQLTKAIYPLSYGTWNWEYDEVGNRTKQIAPSGTTTYTYDFNNRLEKTVQGTTTINYTYDKNGNLKTYTGGPTFTWDVFNRMTRAVTSNGTVDNTYNADGLRITRSGPQGATQYYYDGIRPILQTNLLDQTVTRIERDIFGNVLSLYDKASNAFRYPHPDGVGSLSGLTDAAGAVAATIYFDAWGNKRSNTGIDPGSYRFTGAELDPTTGLYHMGARFYDPMLGRWLSEDPLTFESGSLNWYAYVRGNPLRYTDPTGLQDAPFTIDDPNGMQALARALLNMGYSPSDAAAVLVGVFALAGAFEMSLGSAAGAVLEGVLQGSDPGSLVAGGSSDQGRRISPAAQFLLKFALSLLGALIFAEIGYTVPAIAGGVIAVAAAGSGLGYAIGEALVNPNATLNDLANAFAIGAGGRLVGLVGPLALREIFIAAMRRGGFR